MKATFKAVFLGLGIILTPASSGNAATVRMVPQLPLQNIVLASLKGGGTAVSDRTSSNQYEASGQTIEAAALNGDEVDITTLYLRVSDGTVLPTTGEHKLEIWIGEWNVSTDTAGAELVRQEFDVAGQTFLDDTLYAFDFSTPFSLDQNTDYAFQIWWTSEDATHDIA